MMGVASRILDGQSLLAQPSESQRECERWLAHACAEHLSRPSWVLSLDLDCEGLTGPTMALYLDLMQM